MSRLRKKKLTVFDLTVPDEYDLHEIGLSQSMIYKFFICPVSFIIALNKYRKKGSHFATGWGSLIHYMLDRLYSQFKKTGVIIDGKNAILNLIEDYYKLEPEYETSKSQEELSTSEIITEVTFQEYINFYESEGDFKNFKVEYIEDEFQVYHKYALLRGKFDGILQHSDSTLWLLEHKTMKQIAEEYLKDVLSFDFQSLFYIYCILKSYMLNLEGVQYNVIRNTSMKRSARGRESFAGFKRRLRKDIQKRPKHYFKRLPHRYSLSDKKRFKIELNVVLCEINKFVKEPTLYKRQSSCQRKYTCNHLTACVNNLLVGYKKEKTYFPELEEV